MRARFQGKGQAWLQGEAGHIDVWEAAKFRADSRREGVGVQVGGHEVESENDRVELESHVKALRRQLETSGNENKRLRDLVDAYLKEIRDARLNEDELDRAQLEIQRLRDCIDRRDDEINRQSGCLY